MGHFEGFFEGAGTTGQFRGQKGRNLPPGLSSYICISSPQETPYLLLLSLRTDPAQGQRQG